MGGKTTRYRYGSPGDGGAAYETDSAGTVQRAHLTGPGGLLVDYASGTPTYLLTKPHGDLAEVLDSAGSITDDPVTDEFGVSEAGNSREYGYLGSHRKVTDTSTGLILMGARGYLPTLGRFLQTDPVPGGGANTYVYPTDPVNQLDLNGQCWSWCNHVGSFVSHHAGTIGFAASVVAYVGTGPIGWTAGAIAVGLSAYSFYNNYTHRRYGPAALDVVGLGFGGSASLAGKLGRTRAKSVYEGAGLLWGYATATYEWGIHKSRRYY